jgi:DNA-binding XRE family transcriptional regulator
VTEKQSVSAAIIREARDLAGISQEAAARVLGVSSQTVYRWEAGAPIKDRDMAALRDLYGPSLAKTAAGRLLLDKMAPRGTSAARQPSADDPYGLKLGEPTTVYDPDAGETFPVAVLLRRRFARAKLNELREALLDLDVSADIEDKIVGMASDPAAIASALDREEAEDLTEGELLMALDVISSTALRVLSEIRPRPLSAEPTESTGPIDVVVLPDPAKDRKISEQEAARAVRQAERDRAEREARPKEADAPKRRRRK